MPRQRVAPAARQQPEAVLQAGQQLSGGEGAQPPRRQLDGERDPVEAPAQLPYVGPVAVVQCEPGHPRRRPVLEQLRRLRLGQRRQREQQLALDVQRPAPHGQHPQPRRTPQQLGHQRGAHVHQVLEPVEDQQELALGEMVGKDLARRFRRVIRQVEGLDHRVLDEFRLTHRGEFHAPSPVAYVGARRGTRREP